MRLLSVYLSYLVSSVLLPGVGAGAAASDKSARPWEQYVLSPSTRNPAPVAVHSIVGDASVGECKRTHVLRMRAGSRVSMDFGVEVGGHVSFNLQTDSEAPLSLAFSESPSFVRNISDDTGSVYTMDWDQALEVTVDLDDTGSAFYQTPPERFRGGFRFLTFNALADITIFNITCQIGFAPNMPDLRAGNGYFYTADADQEALNRIWHAAAYTIQTNMAATNTGRYLPQVRPGWAYNATLGVVSPVLIDGAKRDRAIWPGDLGIIGPVAMLAYGAYGREALENSLETLFYYQNASTGMLPFAGPATGSFRSGAQSDTYHAWGLISVYDYTMYSGNTEWLAKHWPNVTRAVEFIVDNLDPRVGLHNQTHQNDWARQGTGGYNSALNALDYHVLVSMAPLSRNDSQASLWRSAAARLKAQYNTLLWDEEAGLYRDNTETTLHAQDGNSLALLYNLTQTTSQATAISAGLERNWNDIGPVTPELPDTISPFISGLELLAHLHGAREPERALSLLHRLWGFLLDGSPDTMTGSTFVEGITANGSLYYRSEAGYKYDAAYTSLSHGWSAGPAVALVTGVLGFRISGLGGVTWELSPQLGGLQSVRAGFETGLGWFEVEVEVVQNGEMKISLESPQGTQGTVLVPRGYGKVLLNGTVHEGVRIIQVGHD